MPLNSNYIKSKIDHYRLQIGRMITFHVPTVEENVDALYDPVSDQRYKVTTVAHQVLARVHWTNDEAITATPGGKYFAGEAYAVIDSADLAIAEGAQKKDGKVTVDGIDLTITKIVPAGAMETNRYKVVLIR